MNKPAIKKYATWARNELITRVKSRAAYYRISEDEILPESAEGNGTDLFSETEKAGRRALIKRIESVGFEQGMEEAAYTWFNRFIALRFMEVNGYLPTKVRVFTNAEGEFKPQILEEAIHMQDYGLNVDMEEIYRLKEENKTEELYKYLLIAQCNDLSKVLPGLVAPLDDYTTLLFPDNIFSENNVLSHLIAEIPAEDFSVSQGGEIEIMGWFYQYYISEKHEEVVDPLHGKIVAKEDIPAATALYTTKWVVQYIVENSVGRYWIERNPGSKLKNELKYLAKPKSGELPRVEEKIKPQELSVFDSSAGSGHFLSYAFDVLMKIYTEYGYTERDAAREIVEHNLFGVDIDERAAQIAYFVVMMKALQYDSRFLSRGVQPNVHVIEESIENDRNNIKLFGGGLSEADCKKAEKEWSELVDAFENAKEYGSIIEVPEYDWELLKEYAEDLKPLGQLDFSMGASEDISSIQKRLLSILPAAKILSQKYAVVCTNPPYLNKFDAKLKKYIQDHYADYKGDLFSVFMYRNFGFCKEGGYSGFMTPNVWMFIQSYEKLRKYIIANKNIATLVQMAKGAFFKEATVDICAFVLQNATKKANGLYFRLEDFKGDMEVQREAIENALVNPDCGYFYEADEDNFSKIPGSPVAYWVSEEVLSIFSSDRICDYAFAGIGMRTGDNNRFLRFWHEVSNKKTFLGCSDAETQKKEGDRAKWIPYNKGGDFRKWYGNNDYVVNWENDGHQIKENTKLMYPQLGDNLGWKISNEGYYYKKGITWSGVTTGKFGCRRYEEGFIFDSGANGLFAYDDKNRNYLAGMLNSHIGNYIISVINPTINTGSGTINQIPVVFCKEESEEVCDIVEQLCDTSKYDWDAFETSWDFKRSPLI